MSVVATSAAPPLAVYRRTIAASLARIWENVLDWEHLPWLHRGAFLDVRLIEELPDGWRAEVRLPPASSARSAEIAVRLDRPALRYVTSTVGGFGAGTEIVTELGPKAPHATDITVAFHVPGVDAAHRDAVGTAYTRLYARLWDEDEAMMIRRQALLDAAIAARGAPDPAPLELGREDDVRRGLPLTIRFGGDEIRVVAIGEALVAHTTVCPHRGGPLADAPIVDGTITCPWHGYRFEVATGASADGRRCRLRPAPTVVIDARDRTVTLHANR